MQTINESEKKTKPQNYPNSIFLDQKMQFGKAAADFVCCRSCQCSIQTFDCVCVCSRSVQYKQWQAKAGTRGDSRKDKMEMTKYIVTGFDCRRFSKTNQIEQKKLPKLCEKVSLFGGKNGWENILPETQGLAESRGKTIPKYIPWSVEKE